MAEPFELFNEKGTPTGIWACGKCRKLVLHPAWTPSSEEPKSTREAAEACCQPDWCQVCKAKGEKVIRGACKRCRDLDSQRWRENHRLRMQKLLEEAEDVSESYSGPVYCEGSTGGDWGEGYFSDLETFLDHTHGERDAPEWVFCCESEQFQLDLDRAIENLCCDGYEGMEERLSIPPSLIEAVAEFNTINAKSLVVWNSDLKRKVRVSHDG